MSDSFSRPNEVYRSPLLKQSMPGLDTVRGLAILAVLSYHELSWQLPLPLEPGSLGARVAPSLNGGFLGVQLFFVLSGFLITGILLDERNDVGFWKRFYVNRLLRLMPALVLVLLFLKVRYENSWIGVLLCLFYLGNLIREFGVTTFHYSVVWSLAVEEQFYLVWPCVVRFTSRRAVTIIASFAVLVTPLLRFLSASGVLPLGNPQSMTWLLTDKLAAGGVLALLLRSKFAAKERAAQRLGLALFATGLILLLCFEPFGLLHRASAAGLALQPVPFNLLFCALILGLLITGDRPWMLHLSRPLRFLGYISYGVYLYHELVFLELDRLGLHWHLYPESYLTTPQWIARFLSGSCVLLILAYISRRYYEDFFLRFRVHRVRPIQVAEPAAQVLAPSA